MDDDPWADPKNIWKSEDERDIISVPSWDNPAPAWGDNSLWSSPADKLPAWHSPYEDLDLGQRNAAVQDDIQDARVHDEQTDIESQPEPDDEPEPIAVISPPPISPPGSPDAFGTFETGLAELPTASVSWTANDSDLAWGGAWAPPEQAEHDSPHSPTLEQEAVDEWEAAKLQKAIQDQHVPPELLASILGQLAELYPPSQPTDLDPNDYRASRHKGLELPMNATQLRLLPADLTLPPVLPFPKSAVAKSTSDALRLSRNAPFIRSSPLGHYSATKGSTAWEASVKNRPEVAGEPDLLPAGWRIVESKPKEETAAQDKKKHGGLLSFFGRRAGTPPVVDAANQRSASPVSASSPRASLESSVKSPTASLKSLADLGAATPTVTSPAEPIGAPPKPVPLPQEAAVDVPAAPSAVSRFLGRFGRKADPTGPRRLSLSEGDFDFLADIDGNPPSTSGFAPLGDFSMSTALLDDPVPLPAKLAPPPPPPSNPVISMPPQGGRQPTFDGGSDDFADFSVLRSSKPLAPPIPKPLALPLGSRGFSASNPIPKPSMPAQGLRQSTFDSGLDDFADFGTPQPAAVPKPLARPMLAPPITNSLSAPTPVPQPTTTPTEASGIDFSAWNFEADEAKLARRDSEPIASFPRPRQPLKTGATASTRPSARRAPTAIMSSGPSKPPASIPKLDSAFSFLPPPPRANLSSTAAAPSKALLLDDGDDFVDFHTPKSNSKGLYETSFSSSTSSQHGLFASASPSANGGASVFDDFDDFIEASPQEPTTLRTPSPPRPPAKPPRTAPAPLTLSDPDDTPLALMQARTKSLSLVENAAASSGVRWPAPPSPLPEALPPPIGSSMQMQQAAFLSKSPPSASQKILPLFPPPQPPVRASSQPVQVLPPQPIAVGTNKSTGGLSAQDLSFFEGL
uniref:Uncharacterized protein n=1 Tax=Mycena chlorophos TaxID=658473 RepID=A0ABQ0LVI4_MYCCL|nr:predicted protein [Mycena chlorophos]